MISSTDLGCRDATEGGVGTAGIFEELGTVYERQPAANHSNSLGYVSAAKSHISCRRQRRFPITDKLPVSPPARKRQQQGYQCKRRSKPEILVRIPGEVARESAMMSPIIPI